MPIPRKFFFAICWSVFVYYHFDLTAALWSFPACLIAMSFGWGRYIGTLGGWEKETWEEVDFIDHAIADLMVSKFSTHLINKYDIDDMRLWGFYGLTLRGAFMGIVLSLPLHSVWPLLASTTMGIVYLASIEICHAVLKDRQRGWELGEVLFGGLIFLSLVL